jgi:hypothetical protein
MQFERDGSNEYYNTQPGALLTTDQLVKELDDIDIVFHNGDIVYANGYVFEWDQYIEQVNNISSRVPWMLSRLALVVVVVVVVLLLLLPSWLSILGNLPIDCRGI